MKKILLSTAVMLVIAASIFGGYYYYVANDLQETVVQEKQQLEHERETEPDATCPECAEEWRADAWRNENGSVAIDGLANAVAQRDAYLAAHNPPDGLGDKGTAEMNWLTKGPQNVGGRTRSLLIDPDDPRKIWAGAVSGGVWKSTDSGDHWSAMNGGLQNFSVTCLAMDINSSRPKTIYAGTGESSNNGLAGGGLFVTTSVSSKWTRIEYTFENQWQYIDSLATTHWEGQTVILAGVSSPIPSQRGIMRSPDGGITWNRVYEAKASLSIVVDPNNAGKIIAEVREPGTYPIYENLNRVVYSSDAGSTWDTATRTDPTRTSTSTVYQLWSEQLRGV